MLVQNTFARTEFLKNKPLLVSVCTARNAENFLSGKALLKLKCFHQSKKKQLWFLKCPANSINIALVGNIDFCSFYFPHSGEDEMMYENETLQIKQHIALESSYL